MSLSWTIDVFENVPSTQDIVKSYAEMETPEGFVVQAILQSEGRGRHGRLWVSERGNLYMSILLRPSCSARHIGQLAMVIAVALAETIRGQLKNPADVMLKWPNDVLINGKKCAGILIETSVSDHGAVLYAVVGVGVNLVSAPPEIGAFLNEHTQKPLVLNKLRDEFLKNLNKAYVLWSRKGFIDIRERWLGLAHKKGSNLMVKVGDRQESGIFHGIDEEGNLLLQDEHHRQKKVTAGEVYLI